jgi:hypothetical protein
MIRTGVVTLSRNKGAEDFAIADFKPPRRHCHVWTAPADQGLSFGDARVVGAVMSSAFCAEVELRRP